MKVTASTPDRIEYVERFAIVQLCREMGWTQQQYLEENDTEFVDDCMKIIGMENSYAKAEQSMQEKRAKRRQ